MRAGPTSLGIAPRACTTLNVLLLLLLLLLLLRYVTTRFEYSTSPLNAEWEPGKWEPVGAHLSSGPAVPAIPEDMRVSVRLGVYEGPLH